MLLALTACTNQLPKNVVIVQPAESTHMRSAALLAFNGNDELALSKTNFLKSSNNETAAQALKAISSLLKAKSDTYSNSNSLSHRQPGAVIRF